MNASEQDVEKLLMYIKHVFVENLIKKYNIMKIRMKISFMAFEQNMTI
jgi:hypothetical protein